ncbi:hypothetical protein PISMIDRAFT_689207, partial [Pisolithus microcarpus 441]
MSPPSIEVDSGCKDGLVEIKVGELQTYYERELRDYFRSPPRFAPFRMHAVVVRPFRTL